MMHGSEWTLKYDAQPSCDIFNLGCIIFQCRTNDRASYVFVVWTTTSLTLHIVF